ncbi:unnamed protein product [Medioppia subpectinata]|uniref:Septin-type G domain-containing protein n=1 Tax=Medioppia subpectinata TaxID=1979941 RepID=A0A7R9KC93_9ACAR|nr:unnamed protein product [Medioppia subpectinata]CAG2100814.1 unnamed protein product [Medioppia subpectinata]
MVVAYAFNQWPYRLRFYRPQKLIYKNIKVSINDVDIFRVGSTNIQEVENCQAMDGSKERYLILRRKKKNRILKKTIETRNLQKEEDVTNLPEKEKHIKKDIEAEEDLSKDKRRNKYNQFDSLLKEESKIRRDPKHADTRVHCLLYFIPSTGNGLTHRDLCFLSRVNNLVNVIPVISKADGLTTTETEKNEEFLSQSILDLKLNSVVPFTIINPEEYSIDRVRMHACGPIEVDNPSNNDSSIIREIILSSHLDTLIEVTSSEIYENYRMEVLESMADQ